MNDEEPHVISFEDFLNSLDKVKHEDIIYFAVDDVVIRLTDLGRVKARSGELIRLTDGNIVFLFDGEVIKNPEERLGTDFKFKFGKLSYALNVVYIRNPMDGVDYRVVRSLTSHKQAILAGLM